MTVLAPAQPAPSHPFTRWTKLFVALCAVLASTLLLKIGNIQYLEIIEMVQIGVLLYLFTQRDFRVSVFRPFLRMGICYLIFAIIVLAQSIFALRYAFTMPADLEIFRRPPIISIARLVELCVAVVTMIYLAGEFRESTKNALFAMRLYFWAGFASAIYSIVTYPLSVAGIIDLGTYLDNHRMRGFFNEGGPYGVYLISVLLVGATLYFHNGAKSKRILWTLPVFLLVFVESSSKAGFLAIFAIFAINTLFARKLTQRVVFLAALAIALVTASVTLELSRQIQKMEVAAADYERLSYQHELDRNFTAGRIAGAFIVPRMIMQHPIAGIGWGNYSLLRNDPLYRGASPWSSDVDDPGLGLLGNTADFGIPVECFLLFILLTPYLLLRRLQAPLYLKNLALVQPVVHLFGAQLNLTYPWIVTAFALGLGYANHRASLLEKQSPAISHFA